MQVIDLKQIQPLDILLTTNIGWESAAIRLGQTVSRGEIAEFSHAAMFIAPTVIVESSDAGVVFERFTNKTNDDSMKYMNQEWLSKHPRTKRLSSPLFIDKRDNAVAIFGGFPDAKTIRVIRHRSFKEMDRNRLDLWRDNFLRSLSSVYLLAYPSYARLLSTTKVPEPLIDAMEKIASRFFGSVLNPGPFCSQLICQVFAANEIDIGPGIPESISPAALAASDQFECVCCVRSISDAEAAAFVAPDIAKLLEFNPTPLMSPLLANATAIVDRAIHYERTRSADLEDIIFRVPEIGKTELKELEDWCRDVSYVFWRWYHEAPKCFPTCVEETQKRTAKIESSIIRSQMKPCSNIFECKSQAFGLSRVQQNIQYLKQKRSDDFLRTINS
jgi:hypothetical protein